MTQPNAPSRTPSTIRIKRYASGKYYLFADAAPEHERVVEQAAIKAARVCIVFDDEIFRATLRASGVLETAIEEYLESVSLIDDVFGVDQNPGRS